MSAQDKHRPTVDQFRDFVRASGMGMIFDDVDVDELLAEYDRMIAQVRREAAAEQREKDAQIAVSMTDNEPDGYYGQACHEAAAAIREANINKEGTQ